MDNIKEHFEERAKELEIWAYEYLIKNTIHFKKLLEERKVLIRINNDYFICSFLGTGAIYTYRKNKKNILFISVSHPHLPWASFETMLAMSHNECKILNMTQEERKKYYNQ